MNSLDSQRPPEADAPKHWTWWALVSRFLVLAVAYICTQVATVIGVLAVDAVTGRRLGIDVAGLATDGFVMSLATCAAAIVCVPLVWLLVHRENARWSFLGLRRCPGKAILLSVAAMAVFIAASDTLTLALGRPLVPPFMISAYASARSTTFLFVAIVLVAPVLEELMFRGFLVGGLRACGARPLVTASIVSIIFAVIHTQYDAYGMASVFLMGVLFVAARLRFDSVVPGMAMHAFANAVGFIEVAVMSGRGA